MHRIFISLELLHEIAIPFARRSPRLRAGPKSTDDVQGQLRGATFQHKARDLMPVDTISVFLGEASSNSEAIELEHTPTVDAPLVASQRSTCLLRLVHGLAPS
jgi:hypothetical protein